MSAELHDLRCKIDTATVCALAAHARAHDMDKPDLVREILSIWAGKQIHGARMLASCLHAKGEAGAAESIGRAASGTAGRSGEMLDWEDS